MLTIICWIMSGVSMYAAISFYQTSNLELHYATIIMKDAFMWIFLATSLLLAILGVVCMRIELKNALAKEINKA